jgi:DNA-binding XRE family transcriptional regulator
MANERVLILEIPNQPKTLPPLPPGIRRTRPRDYVEWKTLRRWGKLPAWEDVFPGYLLREARERAGFTQKEMAARLGCSQQAVAQAEKPLSNPTVSFLKTWTDALGCRLEISLKGDVPG